MIVPAPLRIGIDTGGTFTDVVLLRARGIEVHKVASTPDDPARAVLHAVAALRGDRDVDVVHGSTVGLNAILTGRLARTALVTNEGFRDLVEIGRQARSELYDLDPAKPLVPVPRALRFTVAARREADGTESARPSPGELARLARALAKARVEAVAISLLHAYAHPEDERRIARALRALGVPLTCGASLAPIVGEFERAAGAILNAAITPVVASYLERLARGMRPGRVRLLGSSGGILELATARSEPARALFSGPAGGVVATRALCSELGERQVAGLDMGGTSTDVSLVAPTTEAADTGEIAGLPVPLPTFPVHTVGCGGGSLAWRDAGGALRVGPRSAGADPGPACYGRGDEATITDAHVVLGHLGATTLLGGAFALDPDRAVRAVERLGQRLGLGTPHTARGILEIANATMTRALLVITAERAVDPAAVPLVAFGGAGGLHAAALAARLGMPRAIVPDHQGVFSALGLALAHPAEERVAPFRCGLEERLPRALEVAAAELAEAAKAALLAAGEPLRTIRVRARVRYRGQGPGLLVPFGPRLAASFRAAHRTHFGFLANAPLEVVELRAVAEGRARRLPRAATTVRGTARAPAPRERRALVGGMRHAVHLRADLRLGTVIPGPALVEDYGGTTVVPIGTTLEVGAFGLDLRRAAGTGARRR